MKNYLLGVDIGNTKTQYALADTDGNIAATVYDVGASHENLGPDGAQAAVTEGIGKTVAAAGIEPGDIRFIYYGAAGADTENDFKVLREVYKKVTPDIPYDFENDGYIALKSGTINGVGMLVTNGTSNTNFAMNSKGELKRIGGLSFHTGDTLGAVNMALFVCRAAIRGEDGRAYPTVMSRLIPEAFGLNEVEDIKNIPLFPENIQKVVEIFFNAARMGDGVALELTWMFVKETLHIVDEFHRDLFDHGEKFKLVLDGSVFKQKYQPFMNMLEICLTQRYRNSIQIVVPEWDPVLGAVFHAFEKSGVTLTDELSSRLIRTYMEKKTQ
jgi:N-acetylglucosamine kinase-like BadF-type ATPase